MRWTKPRGACRTWQVMWARRPRTWAKRFRLRHKREGGHERERGGFEEKIRHGREVMFVVYVHVFVLCNCIKCLKVDEFGIEVLLNLV